MSHCDITDYAVHSLEESRVILDVSRLCGLDFYTIKGMCEYITITVLVTIM